MSGLSVESSSILCGRRVSGSGSGLQEARKIDDNSGYIYYQLSENITGYNDSGESYTIECKGKWSAVAYSNLKSTSVNMCDAYNANTKYDFQNSLEECITLYTIENGYFERLSTTEFSKLSN